MVERWSWARLPDSMQTITFPQHQPDCLPRRFRNYAVRHVQADEAECRRMVDYCIDHGITFFDTADAYNGGLAEIVLGKVLKGRRDKVTVASKVGFAAPKNPGDPKLSKAAILAAIDGSLQRLQMDYVDLYYLHIPDWGTPIEESLGAMNEMVKSGKARWLASSNYASWQIVEMLSICEKNGWAAPHITQVMYNPLACGIEQEYQAMCKRFGVSTIVYNPLAGGLLTGSCAAAGSR